MGDFPSSNWSAREGRPVFFLFKTLIIETNKIKKKMNNPSFKMIPPVIEHMSWEYSFDNRFLVEKCKYYWGLNIYKYYNTSDEFDELNNQWVAGYVLYGPEGAEDMLPKSTTLEEAIDKEDYCWISIDPRTHGCVGETLEEAIDKLLKWCYENSLLNNK